MALAVKVLADSVAAVQNAVREASHVVPVGAGTKPALSASPSDDVTVIDVSSLRGLIQYDPAELTFTAHAGTSLSELETALSEHDQHLPFDPLLRLAGSTLGGALATGASGPRAFGPGGIRDFVTGIRLVDGCGRLIAGGGRVVKNAAGFDLPKLMVGSLGRLGVIVEVSCKVFPRPPASATVAFELDNLGHGLSTLTDLARGPQQLQALELLPPARIVVQIAGAPELLDARVARLAASVGRPFNRLVDDAEEEFWREATELAWVPADGRAIRVPLVAGQVPRLDAELAAKGVARRYGLGANVAWISWTPERRLCELDELLRSLGLRGIALSGPTVAQPILGATAESAFATRIGHAIDPAGRFLQAAA